MASGGIGPAESYYLKTIEGASQFFCDWGNRFPHWCVFRLQDGPQPPSPDTPRRPVPLEPRRNYTGALRFRASHLEALPLSLEIPVLTLTFAVYIRTVLKAEAALACAHTRPSSPY